MSAHNRIPDPWPHLVRRAHRDEMTGCLLFSGYRDALGYGRTTKMVGEVKTHRAAWVLNFGQIPAGMCVLHRCDVRHCINPEHLFLGTQQQNIADMHTKGRARSVPQKGSTNAAARLNEDDAWAIRRMVAAKLFTQRAIAESYGVSPMTISRLVNRQTWGHVDE